MEWLRILNDGFVYSYVLKNENLDPRLRTFLIIVAVVLTAVIAYLIGSLNFAIMLSKKKNDDIRNHGSKNAGTTNMLRTYGKKMAFLTLFGDFIKAVIAVRIGALICGNLPIFSGMYIAALFCVLGHVFPVFFKFKGGKGIATAGGAILACGEPFVLLILMIIFAIIVIGTKYVSLASVMVSLMYPMILNSCWTLGFSLTGIIAPPVSPTNVIIAIQIGLLTFIMHWENIKRLWNHTERKVSLFKKKNKDGESTEAEQAHDTKKSKKSLHRIDDED